MKQSQIAKIRQAVEQIGRALDGMDEPVSFESVQVGDTVLFSNGETRTVESIHDPCETTFTVSSSKHCFYRCFNMITGKQADYETSTNPCYIHAVRIIPKPKPTNLTFMQACDLLDSGEAIGVTHPKVDKYEMRLHDGRFTWFRKGEKSSMGIEPSDVTATDWYVVR